MNHLIRALLGASLLFAAPLSAQETSPEEFPEADAEFVGQVNSLLDAAQEHLRGYGYELQSREVSAVENFQNWDAQAYLEAGESYAVVAVCDLDCSDVDLQILDSSAEEAASDFGLSDTAIARFSVEESGSYTLQTRMYGCEAPACYAALGVFRKSGEKTED